MEEAAAGFTDGQSIRVSGSGFGSFSGTRRSFKDIIDASANGTHLIDIAALQAIGVVDTTEDDTSRFTTVNTSNQLFGAACAQCSWVTDGRFGFAVDHGSSYSRAFYRDYVRLSITGASGQWKQIRFTYSNCLTDNAETNAYWLLRYGSGSETNSNLQVNDGAGCGIGSGNSVDTKSPTMNVAKNGVWYEREIEMVFGDEGVENGIGQIRFRRVSDWVEVSNNGYTDVLNFASGNSFRPDHVVIHNYFGNGWENSPGGELRMDGMFLQIGSRQRCYISPQSTWAAVLSTGPRELLDRVTSWGDTEITGTLRQGILDSSDLEGTLYAYVVDDDGDIVNTDGIEVEAA